jgi:hypothetical protein
MPAIARTAGAGRHITRRRWFSASLRLCAKARMATVGVVAVDGTKIGAPASLQANRTKEVIEAEVEAAQPVVVADRCAERGDARCGGHCTEVETPSSLIHGHWSRWPATYHTR